MASCNLSVASGTVGKMMIIILSFEYFSSAQTTDLLIVPLCPILICIALVFFLSICLAIQDGITIVRGLHQIPCSRCAFFTADYRLKCTLYPGKARSEETIDCLDYEPNGRTSNGELVDSLNLGQQSRLYLISHTLLPRRINEFMLISKAIAPSTATQISLVYFQRAFKRRELLPLKSECLWKIEEGIVRTFTWNEEGRTTTLGFWGKGAIVGRPLSKLEFYQIECLTPVQISQMPPDFSSLHDALLIQMREREKSSDLVEI